MINIIAIVAFDFRRLAVDRCGGKYHIPFIVIEFVSVVRIDINNGSIAVTLYKGFVFIQMSPVRIAIPPLNAVSAVIAVGNRIMPPFLLIAFPGGFYMVTAARVKGAVRGIGSRNRSFY